MDTEYRGIYDQCYKGSDVINIISYFKEYKNFLKKSNPSKYFRNEKFGCSQNAIGFGVDNKKCNLLREYCDVENLTVEGELEKMNKYTFEWCKDPRDVTIIENIKLQTILHTKQRNLLKNHQVHLKYRSEKLIVYKPIASKNKDSSAVTKQDILVFIRIYVPFTSRHKQSSGALGKLSVNYVIAILGSQTLDQLKDKINCVSDSSISTEISKAPVKHKTRNAKDIYKSSFFFIEDTFYNDFRNSENKDNSQVIREWAETRNFGPYKCARMEQTRIDGLTLRFGFPWVYQHQGDCEHLISFSDARFINPSDELDKRRYPRILRIKPRPNRYCMTCGLYSVNWVTTNNSRLPHSPCLFCNSCFKSYNYIKGKKVGIFRAYPYPYDSDLLQPHVLEVIRNKRALISSFPEPKSGKSDSLESVGEFEFGTSYAHNLVKMEDTKLINTL